MVTVSVERRIDAPPDAVFDAWIDPDQAGQWLFRTEGGELERCLIDARLGGRFRIDEQRGEELAQHQGVYVVLDRPRRIVFDFWVSMAIDRTRVTVDIAPEGGGSRVTLAHEGVQPDYSVRTRWGWTLLLERLSRLL